MLNILVTGSKGFIGRNLIKKLDNGYLNILEFNRNDSFVALEQQVIQSDFIVHLAAEVRSDSSSDDLRNSNVILTKKIVDILKNNNKKTPILMTSTIHAMLLRNEYGKTKREAEILLENYSSQIGLKCFIYRLPHVFGEGCKPNYNSVISTWMYNSIRDLEINCLDRDISIRYVYVQDIVDDFIYIINHQTSQAMLYIEPKKVYDTTLGQVMDLLDNFKHCVRLNNYQPNGSEFEQKLYSVYLDYYRNLNA